MTGLGSVPVTDSRVSRAIRNAVSEGRSCEGRQTPQDHRQTDQASGRTTAENSRSRSRGLQTRESNTLLPTESADAGGKEGLRLEGGRLPDRA